MRAILSYLKGSWRTMCVIFALLIVQAYCDLTLPTYMSNIVDVGIQQNGVERAVPEQIRSQSMAELSLFLTDEEIGLVKTGYWEEDGVLKGMLRGGPIGADCWEVHQLYIDPFFQREGIGSRLMMAFLEQARESGTSSVILWVLEENLSARSFYERVGFSFGGEIQKVGKTDKRQLLYRLSLEGEES